MDCTCWNLPNDLPSTPLVSYWPFWPHCTCGRSDVVSWMDSCRQQLHQPAQRRRLEQVRCCTPPPPLRRRQRCGSPKPPTRFCIPCPSQEEDWREEPSEEALPPESPPQAESLLRSLRNPWKLHPRSSPPPPPPPQIPRNCKKQRRCQSPLLRRLLVVGCGSCRCSGCSSSSGSDNSTGAKDKNETNDDSTYDASLLLDNPPLRHSQRYRSESACSEAAQRVLWLAASSSRSSSRRSLVSDAVAECGGGGVAVA